MEQERVASKLALITSAGTGMGRDGTPEDAAGSVAWVLSGDVAFVTEREISVDGGFTIGGLRL